MNTSRGLGRLIAITCALAVLCALIFCTSFFTVRAQAADDEVVTKEETEWYSLTENGTNLVVHLQNYADGYMWKYGQSVDVLNERHAFQLEEEETKEDSPEEYVIHFEASELRPAETTLVFSYVKDRESKEIDTKILKVRVDQAGKLEIVE